ncbi:Rox3-domain-containing protein [Teratosphaeria nubilosa]|uniref:Mediator of RNA polymerase II transcription subunit 19 n=1 Tax=Teratosphaeria nubilosa TaxID=161662 RepID=A0A6G1LGS9_9PEZI|nr:Rox3-domain-containing protein [Teratosphaeria nubilosa]
MSEGERPPKRQRLDSYSPASPASETKSFVGHPRTPPPSVHMSPSWQSQSFEQRSAPGSVTFPTPPSTSGLGQPRSVGGEDGAESRSQTPAADSQDQGQHGEQDEEMTDAKDDRIVEDAEHRRTDHERRDEESMDIVPDLPPAPRLYKLRTAPVPPAQPHLSQNVIELYGLQRIQGSVARTDAQGNKINKLRKSYEGKLKPFNLPGKGKAHAGNNMLWGLVDPGWDMVMEDGRTRWEFDNETQNVRLNGLGRDSLLQLTEDAMDGMGKGQLPPQEHKHWIDTVIGLEEPKSATNPGATTKSGESANPLLAKTGVAHAISKTAPASPRGGVQRPGRTGKKRRYDDASFDGYQESFGDEDGGYSTGGDNAGSRRGSASKRQRTAELAGAGRPQTKVGVL